MGPHFDRHHHHHRNSHNQNAPFRESTRDCSPTQSPKPSIYLLRHLWDDFRILYSTTTHNNRRVSEGDGWSGMWVVLLATKLFRLPSNVLRIIQVNQINWHRFANIRVAFANKSPSHLSIEIRLVLIPRAIYPHTPTQKTANLPIQLKYCLFDGCSCYRR